MDLINSLAGDPRVYGEVYSCFGGSGCARLPYLFERALDPAANDNSPAF
jgi:hypothetical protein